MPNLGTLCPGYRTLLPLLFVYLISPQADNGLRGPHQSRRFFFTEKCLPKVSPVEIQTMILPQEPREGNLVILRRRCRCISFSLQ
jgi:hypothetical protein